MPVEAPITLYIPSYLNKWSRPTFFLHIYLLQRTTVLVIPDRSSIHAVHTSSAQLYHLDSNIRIQKLIHEGCEMRGRKHLVAQMILLIARIMDSILSSGKVRATAAIASFARLTCAGSSGGCP